MFNSCVGASSAEIQFGYKAFYIGLSHAGVIMVAVALVFVVGGVLLLALSYAMFARSLFLFTRSTHPCSVKDIRHTRGRMSTAREKK